MNDIDPSEDTGLFPEELAAWSAPEPPAGFADRVLAAAMPSGVEDHSPIARGPRRVTPWIAGAGLVAAAAAAVIVVALHASGPRLGGAGDVVALERSSVELGGRGTAVIEAGGALRWRTASDGAARIDQRSGNVFYRVDRGGEFVVLVAGAEVRVRGTGFRVEVMPMGNRIQNLGAGALGAGLASAVLLTVYEGHVVLANPAGQTDVRAGEFARAEAGQPPAVITEAAVVRGDATTTALLSQPTPATSAELAVQNRALREALTEREQRIAGLRGQVANLRANPEPAGDGHVPRYFPATPEQLRARAEQCEIAVDIPDQSPSNADEDTLARRAESLGASRAEVATLMRVGRDVFAQYEQEMRALYVEATGDTQSGGSLSAEAMFTEIEDKVLGGEGGRARARISRELAGLAPAPRPGSEQPPIERAFRLLAGLGDRLEQALAAELGPDRAREMRAARGGWPGGRSRWSGCPDP